MSQEQQPNLGAQLRAMWREGLKDISNTMHQVFFGQQQSPGEPGTPLSPTPYMVTEDLGVMEGKTYEQVRDGYAARAVEQQENQQEKGMSR